MNKSLNGILVINKPQNMTSHDVVAILRGKLKTKKIGHTGTLDPMATGVLPICVGTSTKIVDYLTNRKKAYRCEITFGSSTDTQDQWGIVTNIGDTTSLNEKRIIDAIESFIGDVWQIPPMYSAIKINGEKLVDLARQGIEVVREPRLRTIYEIKILEVGCLTTTFEVVCSKGTYIRTLCHDIGEQLGCFAHMSSLARIMSEPFIYEEAISIDDVSLDTFDSISVPLDKALGFLPFIELSATQDVVKKILNGVKFDLSPFVYFQNTSKSLEEVFYRVYIDNIFYGVAEKQGDSIVMKKLMSGDL